MAANKRASFMSMFDGAGAVMKVAVCAHCRGEIVKITGDSYHKTAPAISHKPIVVQQTYLIGRYPLLGERQAMEEAHI